MHSADERGNILADKVADLNREWITQRYPQLTVITTTMKEVHKSFITDIPLCVTDGSTPTLSSLHNVFKAQNFQQYTSDREKKKR